MGDRGQGLGHKPLICIPINHDNFQQKTGHANQYMTLADFWPMIDPFVQIP